MIHIITKKRADEIKDCIDKARSAVENSLMDGRYTIGKLAELTRRIDNLERTTDKTLRDMIYETNNHLLAVIEYLGLERHEIKIPDPCYIQPAPKTITKIVYRRKRK